MIKQFHYEEFLPIQKLYKKKIDTGNSISLVIPAYNECKTIAAIVTAAKSELIEKIPLLDEIVVIDGDSYDGTDRYAGEAGAKVFKISDIGDRTIPNGKGTALWKSQMVTTGDITVCIDADIREFDTRFIYGLLAPLLYDPSLLFVKGFYKRPLVLQEAALSNQGGRVTEILVRPLLSKFYPELAELYQPLAGEYSFRKSAVEQVPFCTGYGVEVGLIMDLYEKFGLSSFAQVDMDIRFHRNRNLDELSKMACTILHTIFQKLEQRGMASFPKQASSSSKEHGSCVWTETPADQLELPPMQTINDRIL